MKCMQVIFLVLIFTVSISTKRRKNKYTDNDVLEKSEVTVKYPTYALKIPPIITARKWTSSSLSTTPVTCKSSNVTQALKELRKKIKCKPRETVVEVSAPDGFKVYPNTFVVNRCGGMCTGGKKCLPTRKTDAEFYVRSVKIKTGMNYCNRIKVPEDIECNCGCPQKKKCLTDQKFDPILCKCVCTNKEEEERCLEKINMNFKWKSKDCTCGCKREKVCTTGTVWKREECRCVKE
ncbi:balbiani ring protein 3-like [Tribolium madens]|uniref:balbiani ring protein 3-like n=1 Tax=Tribolium madens TaxID=41895 RepID=UPI001CF72BB0|nr:balbiani ring protein 3-like [Tribolium madens]